MGVIKHGHTGVATNTIVNVKKERFKNRKEINCNCRKCVHSRVIGKDVFCEFDGHNVKGKRKCKYYRMSAKARMESEK